MKAITFYNEIDHDSVKNLFIDIDKIDKLENIILYFLSGGGTFSATEELIDYINRDPKRFELVCYFEMSSCAFELLIRVKCKIKLGSSCLAKVHLYSVDLTYRNMANFKSIDVFLLSDLERTNKLWLDELLQAGCLLEEIDYIKKGNCLVLDQKRMIHIIKSIREQRRIKNK